MTSCVCVCHVLITWFSAETPTGGCSHHSPEGNAKEEGETGWGKREGGEGGRRGRDEVEEGGREAITTNRIVLKATNCPRMWCTCTQVTYGRWHRNAAPAGGSATNLVLECHLFRLLSPGEEERSDQQNHLEHSHNYMPSLLSVLLQSLNLLYTVGLPWFRSYAREKFCKCAWPEMIHHTELWWRPL